MISSSAFLFSTEVFGQVCPPTVKRIIEEIARDSRKRAEGRCARRRNAPLSKERAVNFLDRVAVGVH
jgi:hypothetical protein